MFVSWASIYEGSSDATYFGTLIPRVINDILLARARRPVDVASFPSLEFGARGKSLEEIAREICEGQEAFHLLFSHADTGGRSQEVSAVDRAMAYARAASDLCGFETEKCFPILPRKEMESWALADSGAVSTALGYKGNPSDLGLPTSAQAAERLPDPKLTLHQAISSVKKRVRPRDSARLLASVAQIQSLSVLRGCRSFGEFEASLIGRLDSEGFLR